MPDSYRHHESSERAQVIDWAEQAEPTFARPLSPRQEAYL